MFRLLLLLALLLVPRLAGAEGQEFAPGQSCTMSWGESTQFFVYLSPTKGDPGRAVASIPVVPATPARAWAVPCPTTPGQYYFGVASTDDTGAPILTFRQVPFVITGALPPFVVGAAIRTTAALLNVRTTPGGAIVGMQRLGATGQIVAGPVTASGQTWWQITYATGPSGWSAEAFLVVSP